MDENKSSKKTWHGIPREEIQWHPTVDPDMCIGCGICVLGCGPKVYEFDFNENKSIVSHPNRCKVGCITCENTCPTYAIHFPSLSYLHKIIKENKIISVAKEELKEKRGEFAYK